MVTIAQVMKRCRDHVPVLSSTAERRARSENLCGPLVNWTEAGNEGQTVGGVAGPGSLIYGLRSDGRAVDPWTGW